MRRTKIVCTLGPASESKEMITALADAGMDVARINLSHGSHTEHSATLATVREVSEETQKPIAVLMDLAGPKMRLGDFDQEPVILSRGERFRITTLPVKGTKECAPITYEKFAEQVRPGQTILLADGAVQLKVEATDGKNVDCQVLVGGPISSRKGVNITGPAISIPALTEHDRNDVEFAVGVGTDYIGLSFCHSAQDVLDVKQCIAEHNGASIPVIAKIEKKEAVEQIDEIIECADGVMVARGDLGVELPIEQVPLAQKRIIHSANAAGKPVITATQMLSSMVNNPRPTRAEATDVANAIFDGTDATMLSEETTVGNYPVEAVRTMAKIASFSEPQLAPRIETAQPRRLNIEAAIGHSAATAAVDLGAKAIVAFTRTGRTARLISKYRLPIPIVAISPLRSTVRSLTLVWGVVPILIEEVMSTDHMLEVAERVLLERGLVHKQQVYIVTAGLPPSETTPTNFLRAAKL